VNDLVPEDVLSFAPDIVPIKAARSAVFLVSVSTFYTWHITTAKPGASFSASQQYRTCHRFESDLAHP
jgi:hypothetical protein